MPEQLDPQRLAAERAWIAAYPALINSGLLAQGLIALFSPLSVGAPRGLGFRLVVPLLVLVACAGYARGRRWAGRVVVAWAAFAVIVDLVLVRDGVMALFGAVILFVLYRVRPGLDAASSARPLRWVIPAALVGVVDAVLPLALGGVTPTRVEDVAPITSTLSADLDLEHAWIGGPGGQVRLTPRGDRLVLEGLEIARGQEVAIVPGRRALVVGDAVLRGDAVADPPGGIAFVRRFGRIRGRVVAARSGSEDLHLSFEGLDVDCRRVRVGVSLRRATKPLPEAPERE